jgi:hypothetical protein
MAVVVLLAEIHQTLAASLALRRMVQRFQTSMLTNASHHDLRNIINPPISSNPAVRYQPIVRENSNFRVKRCLFAFYALSPRSLNHEYGE